MLVAWSSVNKAQTFWTTVMYRRCKRILKGSVTALLLSGSLILIFFITMEKHSAITLTTQPDDIRELKQRRFWATHVNRKWAFCSFNKPWRYRIYIASVLILIETICPKICSKSRLKSAKRPFPVDVRRSKTSLLKLPIVGKDATALNVHPTCSTGGWITICFS